jgi:sporulation protein YabP
MSHKLSFTNRRQGMITGVLDVLSFDEKLVVLRSQCGVLTFKGEEMHVKQLDLEKGELEMTGRVDQVTYTEDGAAGRKKGKSVLKRLLQ